MRQPIWAFLWLPALTGKYLTGQEQAAAGKAALAAAQA